MAQVPIQSPYKLPGNANNQRERAASKEPNRAQPVIAGASFGKPKKERKFFIENGRNVWDLVLNTVIVPTIKQLLLSGVNTAANGFLNGAQQGPAQRNPLPFATRPRMEYTANRAVSQQRAPVVAAYRGDNYGPPEGDLIDVGDIYVNSREEALALKNAIRADFEEYEQISAGRVADFARIQPEYTWYDYGWYSLTGMKMVCNDEEGVYKIVLPVPVPLRK